MQTTVPVLAPDGDPWAALTPPTRGQADAEIERLRREVADARDEVAAARAELERESETRQRLARQVEALAAHVGFALPDLPLHLSPPRRPASKLPDDVTPF